jgi:hypothetical protein
VDLLRLRPRSFPPSNPESPPASGAEPVDGSTKHWHSRVSKFSRGANLADERRDTVVFDGVSVTARAAASDEVTEQSLWERTALGRAD